MGVPVKGRGTVWAIEHRFTTLGHQPFDDGWGTLDQHAHEERLPPSTEIIDLTQFRPPLASGARAQQDLFG